MKKYYRDMKSISLDFYDLIKNKPKLFIPFILWIISLYFSYKYSLSFLTHDFGQYNVLDSLISISKSTLIFNALFCPILIIINLWVLNLLKQDFEKTTLNLFKSFFKSIGIKYLMLVPFIFIWMFFQFIFLAIFSVIIIISSLNRGSGEGTITKKIISITTYINIVLMLFLFVSTPGMVFDKKNIFSSIKQMFIYIKKYFWRIYQKYRSYLLFFLSFIVIFFGIPLYITDHLHKEINEYITYFSFLLLFFIIYTVQIKIGQFYLWAKNQTELY